MSLFAVAGQQTPEAVSIIVRDPRARMLMPNTSECGARGQGDLRGARGMTWPLSAGARPTVALGLFLPRHRERWRRWAGFWRRPGGGPGRSPPSRSDLRPFRRDWTKGPAWIQRLCKGCRAGWSARGPGARSSGLGWGSHPCAWMAGTRSVEGGILLHPGRTNARREWTVRLVYPPAERIGCNAGLLVHCNWGHDLGRPAHNRQSPGDSQENHTSRWC